MHACTSFFKIAYERIPSVQPGLNAPASSRAI
jgi:hypothetical protein